MASKSNVLLLFTQMYPYVKEETFLEDEIERIDEDTIYFIITTLNQLNIDSIRNKILLKVLPLKV